MRSLLVAILLFGCAGGVVGPKGDTGDQGPPGNDGPAGACVTPVVNVGEARSSVAGRWSISFNQPSVGPATCDGFAHVVGVDRNLSGFVACRITSVGDRALSFSGELISGRLLLSFDYSGSILLADLSVSGNTASGTSGTPFVTSGVGPLGSSSAPYTITMTRQ